MYIKSTKGDVPLQLTTIQNRIFEKQLFSSKRLVTSNIYSCFSFDLLIINNWKQNDTKYSLKFRFGGQLLISYKLKQLHNFWSVKLTWDNFIPEKFTSPLSKGDPIQQNGEMAILFTPVCLRLQCS